MSLSPVKLEIVIILNDSLFIWWKSFKEMFMMVVFLSINQLTPEHTYGFWNIRRNKACLLIHSKTPYSAWLSAAIILTIWTTLVHFFLWYILRQHRKPLSSKLFITEFFSRIVNSRDLKGIWLFVKVGNNLQLCFENTGETLAREGCKCHWVQFLTSVISFLFSLHQSL